LWRQIQADIYGHAVEMSSEEGAAMEPRYWLAWERRLALRRRGLRGGRARA